jgi:hypothetical protein
VIKPGQKIHASVAFIGGYKPKANEPKAKLSTEMTKKGWDAIIRKGHCDRIGWADGLNDLLEMDLFDYSNVDEIMKLARSDMHNTLATGRLEFLASTGTFSFLCWVSAASKLMESLKMREHRQSPELITSSR